MSLPSPNSPKAFLLRGLLRVLNEKPRGFFRSETLNLGVFASSDRFGLKALRSLVTRTDVWRASSPATPANFDVPAPAAVEINAVAKVALKSLI